MLTVTVGTGDKAVQFPVYEALIRKSSTFFNNAMKPEWARARADPRDIDLSDECPDIFKIYLHWLYFKTFPTVSVKRDTLDSPEHLALSKYYVMGDWILDGGFKNAALDAWAEAFENERSYTARLPASDAINLIYTYTLEGSPARRFLVDISVKHAGESWTQYLTNALPYEFVLEFSRALLKRYCKGK